MLSSLPAQQADAPGEKGPMREAGAGAAGHRQGCSRVCDWRNMPLRISVVSARTCLREGVADVPWGRLVSGPWAQDEGDTLPLSLPDLTIHKSRQLLLIGGILAASLGRRSRIVGGFKGLPLPHHALPRRLSLDPWPVRMAGQGRVLVLAHCRASTGRSLPMPIACLVLMFGCQPAACSCSSIRAGLT